MLPAMKWLVVTIALASCGGSKSDDSGGDTKRAACESAIGRGVELTLEKRMSRGPLAGTPAAKQLIAELGPKLKKVLGELCVSDHWPDSVVSCFQTAPDIAGCKDGLTPEQRQKYTTEMMGVMMGQGRMRGMGGPPGGPGGAMGGPPHGATGTPPAGSATGSH